MADKIIIEVNTRIPSFEGLHDINMCTLPPNRKPYLIMNTEDRIGTVSVTECDGNQMQTIDIWFSYRLLFPSIPTRSLLLLRATALTRLAATHLLTTSLKLSPTIWSSSLKKKSSMAVSLPTCCLSNLVLVTLPMLLLAVWPNPASKMSQCKLVLREIQGKCRKTHAILLL